MIKQLTPRLNTHTWTVQQWLIASILFSIFLLLVRVVATGYLTYIFLVWNLFLAYIPYAISQWLSGHVHFIENRKRLFLVLATWLLFIPNSFYILTDLFHLDKFSSAPKWFDLLMLFSFAWNGLLLGIISMRRVEAILELATDRRISLLIIFAVMWLNAFGIYIGRYLRYNSWDVITQPFSLFGELLQILFHPLQNKMEWGMITVYALFMTLFYLTMKKLSEQSSFSITK